MLENNTHVFAGNWTGTGTISGSGDAEIMTLDANEYMESEIVNIGAINVELLYDNYQTGSGPAAAIQYKDGNTPANCEADTWNTYTTPFVSAGYIKLRIEA